MGSARAVFVGPRDPARPADMSLKVGASDTAGLLGAVEGIVPFGYSPSLHIHHHEDEVFYVVEGAVDFVCGGESFTGQAGAFVFLPRGLPHTFLGRSEAGARVLMLFLPGGLEQMFVATGDVDPGAPAAEHGVEVVGPPLTLEQM